MQTTTPQTPLNAALLRHEASRHEQRTREMQALVPHLQRLQCHVPALESRGVRLQPECIGMDASRKGRPAVRISPLPGDPSGHRLYRVLLGQGFDVREQRPAAGGVVAVMLMTQGALRITFEAVLPLPVAQLLDPAAA